MPVIVASMAARVATQTALNVASRPRLLPSRHRHKIVKQDVCEIPDCDDPDRSFTDKRS